MGSVGSALGLGSLGPEKIIHITYAKMGTHYAINISIVK